MQKGLHPTERFSNRVENYVRHRPGYPNGIIDLLREDCGLTGNSVIADIGSGTGKLSEIFLKNGNQVFGVEPNKEMREAGGHLLKHFPRFASVAGAAEATGFPSQSVDFVTAGQAFHWFDRQQCRVEFLRILKPRGWVVLAWNERRVGVKPFPVEYEKLLLDFATDYRQVDHRQMDAAKLRDFFGTQPRLETFFQVQYFDCDGIKGRLLSSSYAPETGQPGHEEMLDALKRIFEAHQKNGRVAFEYDTRVHFGHLT